jgi:hypothetical protein
MLSFYAYGKLKSRAAAAAIVSLDALMIIAFIAKIAIAAITAPNAKPDDAFAMTAAITCPFIGLMDWWPPLASTATATLTPTQAWIMAASFAIALLWWTTLIYLALEEKPPPDDDEYDDCCAGPIVGTTFFIWVLVIQIVSAVLMSNSYASCLEELHPNPGPCWRQYPEGPYNSAGAEWRASCNPTNYEALAASHFFGWAGGIGTIKPIIEFNTYKTTCANTTAYALTPYYISFTWAAIWSIIWVAITFIMVAHIPDLLTGMTVTTHNDHHDHTPPPPVGGMEVGKCRTVCDHQHVGTNPAVSHT